MQSNVLSFGRQVVTNFSIINPIMVNKESDEGEAPYQIDEVEMFEEEDDIAISFIIKMYENLLITE